MNSIEQFMQLDGARLRPISNFRFDKPLKHGLTNRRAPRRFHTCTVKESVATRKDIAFEFASWISVEFKLYLIKEVQPLKDQEQKQLGSDIL